MGMGCQHRAASANMNEMSFSGRRTKMSSYDVTAWHCVHGRTGSCGLCQESEMYLQDDCWADARAEQRIQEEEEA